MRVEYNSNNSGGRWWLTDDHWQKLEAAGWKVKWFSNDSSRPRSADGRWLGALASEATREGLSLRDAADEWERVTGLSATAPGCPCCGQPHTFTLYDADGKYVKSGPEIKTYSEW